MRRSGMKRAGMKRAGEEAVREEAVRDEAVRDEAVRDEAVSSIAEGAVQAKSGCDRCYIDWTGMSERSSTRPTSFCTKGSA
jgi:hypothetical protein